MMRCVLCGRDCSFISGAERCCLECWDLMHVVDKSKAIAQLIGIVAMLVDEDATAFEAAAEKTKTSIGSHQ